jgi:hypothetical protein
MQPALRSSQVIVASGILALSLGVPAIAQASPPPVVSQSSAAQEFAPTGWPESCQSYRRSATSGYAVCFRGSGFYRVRLICRDIGKDPKFIGGDWQIPGLTTKSNATCPLGYTLAADDAGIEVKAD